MIWLTTALAGGIGIYGEISPGAAWSDASGPLVRGSAARTNFGVFWGPYRSTLQYGRYQRFGLQWGATSVAPTIQGPLAFTLSAGPEYGRGIDLLKLGVYWKVSLNLAFFSDDSVALDEELHFTLGAVARLTGGGVYWLTRYLGVVVRAEGGPDFRGRRGFSVGGGVGLGLIARVGVLTRQQKLRAQWEEEDAIALRTPPLPEDYEPEATDCVWHDTRSLPHTNQAHALAARAIALDGGLLDDRIAQLDRCEADGPCRFVVLEACASGGYRSIWGPSPALAVVHVESSEPVRLQVTERHSEDCAIQVRRTLEHVDDTWVEVDRCQLPGQTSCDPAVDLPACE